jgi:hypothetical protein
MMDKRRFERLAEIVSQVNEIVRGEHGHATGLSQAKLARIIDVQLKARSGRRESTRPAKALLRASCKDPKHVVQALAG